MDGGAVARERPPTAQRGEEEPSTPSTPSTLVLSIRHVAGQRYTGRRMGLNRGRALVTLGVSLQSLQLADLAECSGEQLYCIQ